jgi:hypothetical protein
LSNWTVELDDGTSPVKTAEISGRVKLKVGEIVGPAYGAPWRLDHVDGEQKRARAVPHLARPPFRPNSARIPDPPRSEPGRTSD